MKISDDEPHVLAVLGRLLEEARRLVLREGPGQLRPSQLRVIDSVPAAGGITVTELAGQVGMTKQGIGQFVGQLTADGYLTSDTDPTDRRVRLVRRTALGNDAIDQLVLLLRELERTWADRVGEVRYGEFRAVLDEIAGVT